MDPEEFFGDRASGQDFSYSSYPTVPSIPTRLFGSLKFDSRDSPNSPFSTHFDSEIHTTLSDDQENLTGASPSCNSSIENSTSIEESLRFGSTNTPFLQNASTDDKVKYTITELQSVLMGSDGGANVTNLNPNPNPNPNPVGQGSGSKTGPSYVCTDKRRKVEEVTQHGIPPVNLKELLIECAKALSENKLDDFEKLVEQAKGAVSISGEPIQRLGAYMIEGLVAKKEETGNSIYRALNCKEPEGKDLLSYMHILYEICPYLKFGYMAANGAIAEACKNEDRIHIIDFQIAQGTQWLTLLRALAARPSGAPYVRITGIDDPVSKYARGGSLEAVGKRLAALSKEFNIPVEFNPIPVFAPDITKDMLDVRPGEALAVNFSLQLHHMPDESVDVNNLRDGLLRMVKSLSPKVTTLVEQESNTNTAPFLARFEETLKYYFAIFESIDVTMERDRRERINVEQHCLARDIVNIIACEGKERVERHELFGKWKSRLTMAGFHQYPLSSYVNSVIRGLVGCYSEYYTLVEKDGAMLLGWKDRNLISASAWH